MARVIAIANQKGGVGKTTTAINLAGSLAEQGYRILCVDMDPQANLSVGLGINLRTVEQSMADVLVNPDITLESIVIPTQTPGIDVAPSTIDLSATENVLFSAIGREQALRDALQGWAMDQYDYVIIDCPPTLGLLTLNALVAAQGVIIPVQTQYYALKGFTALVNVINQIRTKGLNPELRILGLLPTFFDARTLLGRDMLQELRDLGDHHIFQNMIKQTVRLGEAPLVGRPIGAVIGDEADDRRRQIALFSQAPSSGAAEVRSSQARSPPVPAHGTCARHLSSLRRRSPADRRAVPRRAGRSA